jgi:hypothetical protein
MCATPGRSSSAQAVDWWDRWLKVRVGRLRDQTRRRVFATLLEIVQAPDDRAEAIVTTTPVEPLDHALRVDLLLWMLGGLDQRHDLGLALVRPGPAELFESDRAWVPAILVATDIAEATLPRIGVVTRWGGLDTTPGWSGSSPGDGGPR